MSNEKEVYLALLIGNEKVNSVNTVTCTRPGCTSTDIKVWEHATRAGDEGVTIFHRCRKCGYVDIDNGQ